MAQRMTRGLLALSSAAVLAVYGVGYLATEPAAASLAAGLPPTATPAQAETAVPALDQATATAVPSATPAQKATSSSTASLKDGTYRGTGWSRRGSVSVTVTIAGGRIVAAPITGTTTHYSPNLISGLPQEVVSRQSSQVDLVSGATDSSAAYQEAVAQALSQAGTGQASAAQPQSPGTQVTSPAGTPNGASNAGPNPVANGGGGSPALTGPDNGTSPFRDGRRPRRGFQSSTSFNQGSFEGDD